ncbi:MAG: hypothetical protein MUO68_17590 [Desulfobacteraceae bacterium]|nr:hypothetical protein [Desulfobacteraceae bacterium]
MPGHEGRSASDGDEALEKRKTFSAEIVISDVRMPKMDGPALLGDLFWGRPSYSLEISR